MDEFPAYTTGDIEVLQKMLYNATFSKLSIQLKKDIISYGFVWDRKDAEEKEIDFENALTTARYTSKLGEKLTEAALVLLFRTSFPDLLPHMYLTEYADRAEVEGDIITLTYKHLFGIFVKWRLLISK